MKANNIFLTAILGALLLFTSCHKQGGVLLVDGQLQYDGDTLYQLVFDLDDIHQQIRELEMDCDTLLVNNGSFTATKQLQKVSMLYILGPDILRQKEDLVITLPAVPGETLRITGTADNYQISGSDFYAQYGEALAAIGINQVQDNAALEAAVVDYINNHPANEASVVLLADYLIDLNPQKALDMQDVLDKKVKEGRFKDYLKFLDFAQQTVEKQQRADEVLAVGNAAPDFTLNDLQGQPFTLSSLRGKYVVLDFWGAWCHWCIKGMPEMKKYYAQYAGQFEIVGIDCHDSEEAWQAAVKDNELPWIHVYNPGNGDLTQTYAIQGFPTKILLDPDGNIVEVVVGEDPAFYALLDELFGQK